MKNLNRRNFVKATSIISLSGTILGLNACKPGNKEESISNESSKVFSLKMVTTWPPNFPILGEGPEKFANLVKKMSNGRLNIKVYGANELIPALESFEAVSTGVADFAHSCPYYWIGKIPAAQFFASIPFGMNSQQMNSWIESGGGYELWRELYKPYNVMPFLAGTSGVQMGGWFNKEINSLEDLNNLKIRMPGLGGKVLEKAGATVVSMAGGEIYTNLDRGVIDATEWAGPYHDYKLGLKDIAKYYYIPGWHELGTTFELLANLEMFNSLPEDLKTIIEVASSKINNWILTEFEVKNAEYLLKIQKEGEVVIRKFPPEVISRLKELTIETIDEIVNTDPDSRVIYDAYLAFSDKINSWAKVSEKVYYDGF